MAKWFDSFGKKPEEVPEALRELKFEDILERSRTAPELATKVAELEASLASEQNARAAATSEFEQTKQRLQALEANARGKNVNNPNNNANPNANEMPSVLEDEDAAFNQRMAPVIATTLHTGAVAARSAFEAGLTPAERRVYTKYRADIDAIMEKEPPQNRIFPERFKTALTYVTGMKMTEIMEKKDEFFSEAPSASSGSAAEQAARRAAEDNKLSDAELEVCAKMGVKPENYLKQKKESNVFVQQGSVSREMAGGAA